MSLIDSLVASPREEIHTIVQETLAAVKYEVAALTANKCKASGDAHKQALVRIRKLRKYLVQKQAELETCGNKLKQRVVFAHSIEAASSQDLARAVESADSEKRAEAISSQRRELDIQVAQYLLDTNHHPEFDQFCNSVQQLPLRELCDVAKYEELNKITDALKCEDYTTCFTWCSAHKAPLRKMRSPLEYVLHTLKYHDLVTSGQMLEGLRYSRQHLTKSAHLHPELTKMITDVFLHASPCDANIAKRKALDMAARIFTENYRSMYGLQTGPLLNTLYAGLTAMHMPICDQFNTLKFSHNNCPCCDPLLRPLTSKTNYAFHSFSTLGKNLCVNAKTNHLHDLGDLETPDLNCSICHEASMKSRGEIENHKVFLI